MAKQGLKLFSAALLVAFWSLGQVGAGGKGAPDAAKADLEKAVAAMRRLNAAGMSEENRRAKAKVLTKAWVTMIRAKEAGAARLLQEVRSIDAAGEKDHFFKLGAGALLWRIGRAKHAGPIARIWQTTPLNVQYNYVFYTAFEAARTQDPNVLPMLAALLRDDKGRIYVAAHAMPVRWPLTHEFIWDQFGPKGLPALKSILEKSNHRVVQASAALILARSHYLPALPGIRRVAAEGKARSWAIRCLGEFGHPEDFDALVGGLRSKDPRLAREYAYALYEYEDLRAVQHLVPLLASKDPAVRQEIVACLGHLRTTTSVEALHRQAAKAKDQRFRKLCQVTLDAVLKELNLGWDAWITKSIEQKRNLLAKLRRRQEAEYRLKTDDRRLTRDDLLKAAAGWKKRHRITGGPYEWVKDRHVLAVAKPADLDLLRDVRASLYARLSDECLYEVRKIQRIIRRIGRSRYRKVPGLCDGVEPVGKAPPGAKP